MNNSKDTYHIAREQYNCDGFYTLLAECDIDELDENEKCFLRKIKDRKFPINKGEEFIYRVRNVNGQIQGFRIIPEIDRICKKYGILI